MFCNFVTSIFNFRFLTRIFFERLSSSNWPQAPTQLTWSCSLSFVANREQRRRRLLDLSQLTGRGFNRRNNCSASCLCPLPSLLTGLTGIKTTLLQKNGSLGQGRLRGGWDRTEAWQQLASTLFVVLVESRASFEPTPLLCSSSLGSPLFTAFLIIVRETLHMQAD